ncbi:NAD-dependent epimerase/dehydratase family protein [Paeniglutamicibacter psychrophenolicus]|uniref:NAD-dependent epimerase/dehydratase family protein n=1 Tax=Paeniglutamicibacter psychrophenolicus TaxID=257454 RepID=UPI00277DB830|nr:NAD-dependent epimerase/dehydratase family protein [Paeniglutamicibacter psychrophenolicus]MDQ0096031.1 nucleoside-diphosphate-sugar epimerase [Paeniglutamicibacter psychrophenolicus]
MNNQAGAPIFVTGGSGMLGSRVVTALVAEGYPVHALARSEAAGNKVAALGALPCAGDLHDEGALLAGLVGCDAVIHCAAATGGDGAKHDYVRDNLEGTRSLLRASMLAGAGRFIHVGAAMCLLGGRPVDGADETWPLHESRFSGYITTKTLADRAVRAAATERFATTVIRPAWIWGAPGDPQLQGICSAIRSGRMRMVDAGRHRIVTSHVDNVVSALLLALHHGHGGDAYYVFDEDALPIRDFLGGLVATQGLGLPPASIPAPVAKFLASVLGGLWALARKPGPPPLDRLVVELNARDFLVSDQLARDVLGYRPPVTRAEGLARLRRDSAPSPQASRHPA